MPKVKVIRIDRELSDKLKKEASNRGMHYWPFAAVCMEVGLRTIKESPVSIAEALSLVSPQSRPEDGN